MSKVYIPEGYKTPLSSYEMQRAIEFIKSNFQVNLSNALNLRRVSAPLFVADDSGLNDNLNGVERPVSFDIPALGGDAHIGYQTEYLHMVLLRQVQGQLYDLLVQIHFQNHGIRLREDFIALFFQQIYNGQHVGPL